MYTCILPFLLVRQPRSTILLLKAFFSCHLWIRLSVASPAPGGFHLESSIGWLGSGSARPAAILSHRSILDGVVVSLPYWPSGSEFGIPFVGDSRIPDRLLFSAFPSFVILLARLGLDRWP